MTRTFRQKLFQWVYPLFMAYQKWKGKRKILYNRTRTAPHSPFHTLSVVLNNGRHLPFTALTGKKVLLVNTASNCGYTAQFNELQKLYQHSKEDLEIIAFPSNDFKEQESGTDADIAAFCTVNFAIRFPLAKKTTVRKGPGQHAVFSWLTRKELNGWNDQGPSWNFAKYLVDEKGVLTHYFDPAVSPLSEEVIKAVHQG